MRVLYPACLACCRAVDYEIELVNRFNRVWLVNASERRVSASGCRVEVSKTRRKLESITLVVYSCRIGGSIAICNRKFQTSACVASYVTLYIFTRIPHSTVKNYITGFSPRNFRGACRNEFSLILTLSQPTLANFGNIVRDLESLVNGLVWEKTLGGKENCD